MTQIQGNDEAEFEGNDYEARAKIYSETLSPEDYAKEYQQRAYQDYSDEVFFISGYYDLNDTGSHSVSTGELALLAPDEEQVKNDNLEDIKLFHSITPFVLRRFALIDLGPVLSEEAYEPQHGYVRINTNNIKADGDAYDSRVVQTDGAFLQPEFPDQADGGVQPETLTHPTTDGHVYNSGEEFIESLEADGGTVSPAPNSEPAHVEQEKPVEEVVEERLPTWPNPRPIRDEPQA